MLVKISNYYRFNYATITSKIIEKNVKKVYV